VTTTAERSDEILVFRLLETDGFEMAVTEARRATHAANAEAEAARNGVGLVKLMGRDSGFIAPYSALVNNHVNFCLIPEVPFTLDKFLPALQERPERRSHAVIAVAEGAGQNLMAMNQDWDASGNVKHGDVGVFSARRDRQPLFLHQPKRRLSRKSMLH
jgi:6-phosphofructokinase 1